MSLPLKAPNLGRHIRILGISLSQIYKKNAHSKKIRFCIFGVSKGQDHFFFEIPKFLSYFQSYIRNYHRGCRRRPPTMLNNMIKIDLIFFHIQVHVYFFNAYNSSTYYLSKINHKKKYQGLYEHWTNFELRKKMTLIVIFAPKGS